MFSVVIISRDATPKTLRRALRSVQSQVYPPNDVVVVEHGETNESQQVVDAHQQRFGQKLQFVRIPGAGTGFAKNTGFDHSRGAWVTFVDAADELMPLALENYERLFRRTTDAEVCYGRAIVRDAENAFIPAREKSFPTGDLLESLYCRRIVIAPSTFVCRRSVLEGGLRFTDSAGGLETFEFLLRLAERYRFFCVQEDAAIVDWQALEWTAPRLSALCELLEREAPTLAGRIGNDLIRQTMAAAEYEAARLWWLAGNTERSWRHLSRVGSEAPGQLRFWLLRALVSTSPLLSRFRRTPSRAA